MPRFEPRPFLAKRLNSNFLDTHKNWCKTATVAGCYFLANEWKFRVCYKKA